MSREQQGTRSGGSPRGAARSHVGARASGPRAASGGRVPLALQLRVALALGHLHLLPLVASDQLGQLAIGVQRRERVRRGHRALEPSGAARHLVECARFCGRRRARLSFAVGPRRGSSQGGHAARVPRDGAHAGRAHLSTPCCCCCCNTQRPEPADRATALRHVALRRATRFHSEVCGR